MAFVAQAPIVPSGSAKKAPLYTFLSRPPPQKKWPTQPLPSSPSNSASTVRPNSQATAPVAPPARPRSATTSSVMNWLANVRPGSPAPNSPPQSPPVSPRQFFGRSVLRRPSVASSYVAPSFLNFQEIPSAMSGLMVTPAMKEFAFSDFAGLGYTSLFIKFPVTPASPNGRLPPAPTQGPKKTLKPFRSLSALRPSRGARSKATNAPPSINPGESAVPNNGGHDRSLPSIKKAKKPKYLKYRPAPLNGELALAQFMDGGRIDDHALAFAKSEAKAAGALKIDGHLVGVGTVWRDGQGSIWRDQDEELEYAHLLGGRTSGEWVHFGSDAGTSPLANQHRDSISTKDSDLSPRYAMKIDTDLRDDLVFFSDAPAQTPRVQPGMTILAIPSRSRRTEKHLRKPEFLLNVFPIPTSPTSVPKSAAPPRSVAGAGLTTPPKGRARRRPAPLQLAPIGLAFKYPTNPLDPDFTRRDFIEDSFVPFGIKEGSLLPVPSRELTTQTKLKPLPRKPSALHLNVKGILKGMTWKKASVI